MPNFATMPALVTLLVAFCIRIRDHTGDLTATYYPIYADPGLFHDCYGLRASSPPRRQRRTSRAQRRLTPPTRLTSADARRGQVG
jgi:hypothetical protein